MLVFVLGLFICFRPVYQYKNVGEVSLTWRFSNVWTLSGSPSNPECIIEHSSMIDEKQVDAYKSQ
jgi:hypothetical protein